MGDLVDDVIIITGASRGLGREMALRFSEEGTRVVLNARSEDDLEAVAAEATGETLVAPGDVTDPDEVQAVIDAAVGEFGRIDTLVNNAGVGLLSLQDRAKRLTEVTADEWDVIIDTNLKGVFLFTKAVLPVMLDHERGNVINISSGVGRDVYLVGDSAWTPYTVSKWGLEALTKITDVEYSEYGINSNSLDPGGRAQTKFWDHLPEEEHQEILEPDVMNDAAVLLAAQGPDGISGEAMDAAAWEEVLGGP